MTTLRINPFHLRPQIKNMFHRPKHVEIPANINPELYNKLIGPQDNLHTAKYFGLQSSLDYLATHYNINFKFIYWPFKIDGRDLSIDKVECKRKGNTVDTELIYADRDDEADIAKNICLTVSNVMESKKQTTGSKLYGVTTKNIPDILKPTFKIYSGILEYYAKKYDGMKFTAVGINGKNGLTSLNSPQIIINCKYNSKEANTTIYKTDHAVHTSKANSFYTDWGSNLNDFYENKTYKEIYYMVRSVLEPNGEQPQAADSKPLQ